MLLTLTLCCNKAAPAEGSLCKLGEEEEEKKTQSSSMCRCEMNLKTIEMCRCQCLFGGISSLISLKIYERWSSDFDVSVTHVMCEIGKEGCYKYWPTFITKLK
jgi:hypothetical protein